MAILDRQTGKIVVHIVYDGPAFAGKTTNLQQLCQYFTTLRRSELLAPETSNGRTLYFDWMHLDGGVVAGRTLRCHLVTVPGQAVLARRRWKLVSLADAIVYVLDSTPDGVEEARFMFNLLRQFLDARGMSAMPLVIQANKQDREGALGPDAIKERLGAGDEVAIVAGQAESGHGVRETAVLAIRAAADRVQRRALDHGIESLEGDALHADELRATIDMDEASHPMSPVEVVLNQARDVEATSPAAPEEALVRDEASPPGDIPEQEPQASAPQPDAAAPPEPESAGDEPQPVAAPPQPEPAPEPSPAPSVALPTLPGPDVPSGFIWPAATGRDVLRGIPVDAAQQRADLVGSYGVADGSGSADALIFRAGQWCLKTSGRRCFIDADQARSALLQLARRKLQLGELLVRDTVLSVDHSDPEQWWLWTVCPWLPTFRHLMSQAVERDDEQALGDALLLYTGAVRDALWLMVKQDVVLDVHPSNFAVDDKKIAYIDDDIGLGGGMPSMGYALLQRFDEYQAWPRALGAYMQGLQSVLCDDLGRAELEQLQVEQALRLTIVRSVAARDAREGLLGVLSRRR